MKKEVEALLLEVQKPARYIGNEFNSVHKDAGKVDARFAFCFPDVYDVGMSHLGMKILYHLLNEREDIWCERVFAPWPDMEEKMREKGLPLFALESGDALTDFDVVGFTLQYEMCYTNLANMLDLAGIPLYAKDRGEGVPFVCAGGPCAYNCEPIADFLDFVMLGEGEEQIIEVMDAYIAWKKSGQAREAFLAKVAEIDGIYVPSFYDVAYHDDQTVASILPNHPSAKPKIQKRIIRDMDSCYFPERFVVPFCEIVHDRIMLELFRGCIRGCRFCQAGMIYRPVRERSPEKLLALAEALMKNTGYEEISLTSLSTSDYTKLPCFTENLLDLTEREMVSLSLPSLRLDSFSFELMEKVQKVRKTGLTFAPEAGTQRLRDVINKGITEEDLMRASAMAFEGGWTGVKLYFMIGLPTETMEDVAGIATLGQKVVSAYYMLPKEKRSRAPRITISTSSFVPKAFTPFQWEAQDSQETLREKQVYLKSLIHSKQITYHWHESSVSYLEGVFARGDRRLSGVIARAVQKGCKFDGWSEYFRMDLWLEAFKEEGIDPDFYTARTRGEHEVFPWDHIDVGVSKAFLWKEHEKAMAGEVTPHCREKCSGCGANALKGGASCG